MTMSAYEPPAGGGEVEQYQPESRDVRRLRDWAEAASAAHAVAISLCKTSFVPKEYRDKPHETTAAILAGFELGLDPMQAVKAFSPIQGQAAPTALTQVAVVLSRGHEIELVESTAQKCTYRGRRRGSETWQTVTWTIDQARGLGLLQRNPEWRKQPATMLIARCSAQMSRIIAPDALKGIPYAAEELRDLDPDAATDADAAPTRRRRATPAVSNRPEPVKGSSPESAADGLAAPGRPPLPGEPGYDGSDEPAASTDDAAEVTHPLAGEAAVIREALEEHADEVVAEMAARDEAPGTPIDESVRRPVFKLISDLRIPNRQEFAAYVLGRAVESYGDLSDDDYRQLRDALLEIKNQREGAENDNN